MGAIIGQTAQPSKWKPSRPVVLRLLVARLDLSQMCSELREFFAKLPSMGGVFELVERLVQESIVFSLKPIDLPLQPIVLVAKRIINH